jgi:hypothetical protein
MTAADKYLLFADIVLIAHALTVGFVVIGFFCVVLGRWLGWRWIFNPVFRWGHVAVMLLIAGQAVLGQLCPLTSWENLLRERAGSAAYSESFVQHWLHRLLFFEAPFWVFTTIYTAFALVLLSLWLRDRRRL